MHRAQTQIGQAHYGILSPRLSGTGRNRFKCKRSRVTDAGRWSAILEPRPVTHRGQELAQMTPAFMGARQLAELYRRAARDVVAEEEDSKQYA